MQKTPNIIKKRRLVLMLCMCFVIVILTTSTPVKIYAKRGVRKVEMNGGMWNLKLMTYNIRHGKGLDNKVRIERIADVIEQSQADIVGLQEVDRYQVRSGFKDQVQLLADRLGMYSAFSRSIRMGFGEYGNALLSRYPLTNVRVRRLPSTKETRSLLLADVTIGGDKVTAAVTHLGLSAKDHKRQPPFIQHILMRSSNPIVLLGDFNMEASDSHLQALKKKFPELTPAEPDPTFLDGSSIDHIYTNLPLSHYSVYTISSQASDHVPLVGDIEISANRLKTAEQSRTKS